MNRYLLAVVLMISTLATQCSQKDGDIESLDTIPKQIEFLQSMRTADQSVRKHETRMITVHGYDSPEFNQAWEAIKKTDEKNLTALREYIALWGHPSRAEHGDTITGVPWLVVHHSPNKENARREFFPVLYAAYQAGDISADELSFFLNRLYNIEKGHRIRWNRPFDAEQEIDTVMQVLGLHELL